MVTNMLVSCASAMATRFLTCVWVGGFVLMLSRKRVSATFLTQLVRMSTLPLVNAGTSRTVMHGKDAVLKVDDYGRLGTNLSVFDLELSEGQRCVLGCMCPCYTCERVCVCVCVCVCA